MAHSSVPLTMVGHGESATLVAIQASSGLARRLADMGLVPGTTVRIINSHMSGPVLIEVKGYRLALGHGIAQKIMVDIKK
ncbi:ferrous iron transport protein A [Chloroflexota bacterium]